MGSVHGCTPMVTIPVINVSGYLVGDPKATAACAAALRDACENQGFLQVVGHSVPEITQKNFLYAITRFFALLQDEKETLSQDNSPCHRGYERIGGQKLDELNADATPDQKEGFSIRPERPLGKFLAGPNQWPDENRVPGFKEAYMEYFWAVHSLSKAIFQLMALSLGLDRTCFDAFAADPDGICLCRAHHYNPTPKDAAGRTRGVGAHTDFGAITLLLQDTIGGLEVLRKPTGTWHPVPPIEGAYVCNIGDLMQRWTNDRYRSTMHRVISPLSQTDRYSCAFFNDGALDMIIEPLPTCIPEGESPAYEPLKVETHILQRYQQSYGAGGTHIKRKA